MTLLLDFYANATRICQSCSGLAGLVAASRGSELPRNSQLSVGSMYGHVLASASFTLRKAKMFEHLQDLLHCITFLSLHM